MRSTAQGGHPMIWCSSPTAASHTGTAPTARYEACDLRNRRCHRQDCHPPLGRAIAPTAASALFRDCPFHALISDVFPLWLLRDVRPRYRIRGRLVSWSGVRPCSSHVAGLLRSSRAASRDDPCGSWADRPAAQPESASSLRSADRRGTRLGDDDGAPGVQSPRESRHHADQCGTCL